ncbi:MAG: hypothetical protein ACRDXX_15090 [Stackebrandtia sp.]
MRVAPSREHELTAALFEHRPTLAVDLLRLLPDGVGWSYATAEVTLNNAADPLPVELRTDSTVLLKAVNAESLDDVFD